MVVGEKLVLVLITNLSIIKLVSTFVGSNPQLCAVMLTSKYPFLRFATAYGKM